MEKSNFLRRLVLILLIFLLPYVNATVSGPKWPKASKHFVLVHGACHGAWSWYKIMASIKNSGHIVTALDLGASGINPKQVLEVPHLSDYFSPLMEFMASLPAHEKVSLVGHSLGGFAISKAMESFPEKISVAVFVTALMPGPTLNATTIFTDMPSRAAISAPDNRVTYNNGPTNPPTTFSFGPKYLASHLYQLSPIQDRALATTVIRPLYLYSLDEMSKEIVLSRKKYGSIRRVFIVADEDKTLPKEFQQWMIEKNPPDEVEEISGSDHMVMDWALATTVVRPLYLYSLDEMSKEIVLSRKKYGSIRRVFIVADEDKTLPKEFQQWMIEKNPPDEVEEISGSDHMVMDWALATTVVRPLYLYSLDEMSKEIVLSRKKYGSIRRVFIVADEDKTLPKEFQQWMIEKNPPDEVEEISGSDHMVMDWALATTVVRPLYLYSLDEMSKEIVLSRKKYGSIRRVFIVADEDKTLPKEFQQWMIEKNPPDEVEEISGSDHMVMDWALATTVVRPLYLYSLDEMSKEIVLSRKKYGSIRRVFIVADEDKTLPKEFQQWMIEKNPPDEVEEISGSDHMVMDWALATTVVRPLYLYSLDEMSKEIVLSRKKYGSIRRVFIVADEDKTLPMEFQQWMIEKNPPDEVEEISGSDHMVMDWALATTVVRPLYLYSLDEMSKEIVLSRKKYGSIRRVFIVADEDKTLPKEFQQWMIEKNPPDEVEEISGSDHMVMDWALATTVVRPLYLYSLDEMSKEIVLSRKKYGSIRRVFIVADEDKTLPKEFQQWMIEKNPPDEVEEISGSDHMVMDWALATTVVRPLYLYSLDEMSKEIVLSRKKYGSIRRVFIVADEDKTLPMEFQQWMIEKNPPDEVEEISGSDHMVMDWALATTVVRPLYLYSLDEMSKEIVLSRKKYGSIRRVFIVADEDKTLPMEFQQWMIEKNPPDEVEEISGSDHMVMDWALATTVVRPLYLYSLDEMSKEIVLSRKKYGSIRRVFIVADEDKTLPKEFQQWMIEKNPPDEVEEISGSDHMVMVSKL